MDGGRQQLDGVFDCRRANGIPIAGKYAFRAFYAALRREPEPYQSDWLFGASAARTCDSGDGDRKIGFEDPPCALRHGLGAFG